MKAAFVSLFAFVTLQASEIPKNTHVLLKMVNSISTRTAVEGTQVYLQTASPISDGSGILVPVGSYVQGTVIVSHRSGKVSGRAQLAIRLEVLTLPGGKVLKFAPHVSSVDDGETTQKVVNDEGMVQQGSNVGKDVERIAILAGSGAGIGGMADRSWTGAGIGGAAGGAVGLATTLFTRAKKSSCAKARALT